MLDQVLQGQPHQLAQAMMYAVQGGKRLRAAAMAGTAPTAVDAAAAAAAMAAGAAATAAAGTPSGGRTACRRVLHRRGSCTRSSFASRG